MESIKKLSKKQIIGLVVGIVIVVGIIAGLVKGKSVSTMGTGNKNGVMVDTHTVALNSISAQISTAGEVEANSKDNIYSETNGTIEEVLVEVGDVIKAGDVILRFEKDTKIKLERELEKLNLQLSLAKSDLGNLTGKGSQQEILAAQTSLAQVEQAEKDLLDAIETQKLSIEKMQRELETAAKLQSDQEVLLEAGMIAPKEYDDTVNMVKGIEDGLKTAQIQLEGTQQSQGTIEAQKNSAKYALDTAQNNTTDKNKKQMIEAKQTEIKSMELQVEALQEDIEKAAIEVVSSMDGTVSEVMVADGATVGVGTPLVTILDISTLKVISDVSTYNAPQIKIGQKVIIKQDSLEAVEYEGVVSEIAPASIKKQSGTNMNNVLPITIEIKDKQTDLKPGYNVDVKIKTIEKDGAITLPILSIMEDDDEDYKYAFVIKEDNTLEKREIIELALDNISIEVEGVQVGEKVVANPTEDLEEGMLVLTEETGEVK